MKINTKVILAAGVVSLFCLAAAMLIPVSAYAAAGTCYQNASKSCVSNIAYWYDSCGNIQSVAQNCNSSGQMCQSGVCVNKTGSTGPATTTYNSSTHYQLPPAGSSYIQNYRTYCYNGNVQWYDSRGAVQGTYQTCQDSNSCTVDSCMDNACRTQLKCDGSTCAVNSADYMTYCANNLQGTATVNNTTTNNTTTNNTTVVNQSGQVAGASTMQNMGLSISLFGKKEGWTTWVKNLEAQNNEKLDFLMVIKNTSGQPVNNVLAAADIGASLSYAGNLSVDGVAAAGSVVSGIDLGTIGANTSKVVQFSATVQSENAQTAQVVGRVTAANMADSDFFTTNITASSAAASVSGSPFMQFIKRWYLWLIIVIVLIALFVIIFRRLSTNP